MDYRQKHTATTVVLVFVFGLLLWAFGRITAEGFGGHVTLFTKVVFFGSAAIGLVAAVCRKYWWQMREKDYNGQKIALDVLSKMGQEKLQEKRRKSRN